MAGQAALAFLRRREDKLACGVVMVDDVLEVDGWVMKTVKEKQLSTR